MNFLSRIRFYLMIAIALLCASNVEWGGQRWKNIIAFDGKGYYSYLPAIFIYNDLEFNFHDSIEEKYYNKKTFYDYRVITEDGTVNKYFAGSALMQLPFFLISHLAVKITGSPADGYSFLYQLGVSIAGIFYVLLGLFFLMKLLRLYNIIENNITLVLLTIFFGTHLFFYSVFEPSYSHVYSFAVITAFVYYLKKYALTPDSRKLVYLGLLLGVIVLIRPVNGLIILILPFIAGSKENLIETLRFVFQRIYRILIPLFLFVSVISIQGLIYYLQIGKFFFDSYTVEGFHWNRPEIINILFSYRKGLFLYTPALLLSLIGLLYYYRNQPFPLITFLLFLTTLTYVFSCWWMWSYGGSFSSRPYVDFLSLFGLGLAMGLSQMITKSRRMFSYAILILLISICQIQTMQFRYNVIHWDAMDKEHYWRAFLRVDLILKKDNPNRDLLEK